jgi:hypothetical protein
MLSLYINYYLWPRCATLGCIPAARVRVRAYIGVGIARSDLHRDVPCANAGYAGFNVETRGWPRLGLAFSELVSLEKSPDVLRAASADGDRQTAGRETADYGCSEWRGYGR